MSYHDDSSNIGCTIIFCIAAVVACFLFAMCQINHQPTVGIDYDNFDMVVEYGFTTE